jgi:MFS family permease
MSAQVSAASNVRRYYVYRFLADFLLWSGVWIKYLTVDRGLELRWILLMDLPFWLCIATLEVPFGTLGDRLGRKRLMAAGMLTFAATIFLFGLTSNYWLLFVDYILWAISSALMSGVDQALLYDSLKESSEESRFPHIAGRALAIGVTAGFVSVLLGGLLAANTSLGFTVRISAIFPIVGAVVALSMREPDRAVSRRHYLHDLREGFAFTWRTVQVRHSVILRSVLMAAGFAPVVLVQPFLISFDVSTGLFGVYQAPLRLVSVVAALMAAGLAARAGSGKLFAGGCVAVVLAFSGLGLIDHSLAFVLFAVPAFMQSVIRPTMDNYINARTPSQMRATVLSVASLCLSLQLALFEPILGFIADGSSVPNAALFCALWFGVLLPPMLYFWRRADSGRSDVLAPVLEPA